VDPPINFLTFHRDTVRHRYFSSGADRGPLFDIATRTWIITKPLHCKELIASSNLRPISYAQDYELLQGRLGIDFSSLVFAFSNIPLCLHGERHAYYRRRVSELLASRRAAVNARIPEAVAAHLDCFRHEGRLEVMQDVVLPLVLDIISTTIDVGISPAECRNASLVFDKSIGVAKRRKIAAEIATLRKLISCRLGAGATEEDVGLRLALLILGKDALVGTLGESLHRWLQVNSGCRLAEIGYPEFPPETGVPFIERSVVRPFTLASCEFACGDRVRIFLQTFAYSDEPRSSVNFFGGGAHACLGRSVSIQIWNAVTDVLATIPLRAHVFSYSARASDYVFTCPERLEVDLCP
jgi:cytochrome P450